MSEQEQNSGAAPASEAPALQPAPEPVLPPNPVASLRRVFRDVAAIVGEDKATFILTEFYGVTSPDALRAADLLDAIDKLYEAA